MNETNIYNYGKSSLILGDLFQLLKKKNPRFSLRGFAKKLGLKSHASLSRVLSGDKPCPKDLIPHLAKVLNLSSKEAEYLETLIDYERAKSFQEKDRQLVKIKKLTRKSKNQKQNDSFLPGLEIQNFKYVSNPLCAHLLEMFQLSDFKLDLAWMQSKLRKPYRQIEIKEALNIMVQLGILQKQVNIQNGKEELKIVHAHFSSQIDIPNEGLKRFHQSVCSLASESVKRDAVDEREFNAFAFCMKKEDMPRAKKAIREFIADFIAEFNAETSSSIANKQEIVQLATQLFPITQ